MQSNNTPHIDFSDTEIAFNDKSNFELYRAYQLFLIMNNPALVKLGKHLVNLSFALHLPIKGILRNTIYKQFVGGMSIEDCGETIKNLAERNVKSILDYAPEGGNTEEMFESTYEEILLTIKYAQNNIQVPFCVFKITGIARFELLVKVSNKEQLTNDEKAEYQRVLERVEGIFGLGYKLGKPVLIDSEESWIQPMLDDLVINLMQKYNKEKAIVQNTYQMYRHDSIKRIKEHHELTKSWGVKFGLKIVRGAYMEKERDRAAEMGYPSPIQPDKASTDHDFNEIIHYFIQNIDTIDFMVATHNERSSLLLASLIEKYNLPRNHPGIYFSQLYGMSDNLTFNLADGGYNVAKYVPYGEIKTMMPYLFRRAEENTSVKGQTSRELNLIKNERNRRKTTSVPKYSSSSSEIQ